MDSGHKFDRHSAKQRYKKRVKIDKTPSPTQPKCDYCASPKIIGECFCNHQYCSQECADKLHGK